MSGQWIFIEAADVWLFRDNKPFTAQQNFVARGQFPPTPMTVQGAIRTRFLEQRLQHEKRTWDDYRRGNVSEDVIDLVGLPAANGRVATMGRLRVTGLFVARMVDNRGERLFAAPADLLSSNIEAEESERYELLKPAGEPDFHTTVPFAGWQPLSRATGGDESGRRYKEASGWLTEEQFRQYLDGNVSEFTSLIKDQALFQTEDRVGLGMDYKRRANAESMFYRAEFVRPCDDVGLLVHVNQPIFEDQSGYLNLGGESRFGYFRIVNAPEALPQTGRGRVKIVLLTPAYFSGGWQPESGDWRTWVGDGRLVSVAIGKSQAISGWDIANHRPKPLRHYVPAGSVFFFEDAELTGVAFTETPPDSPDHGAMGFGAFAAGTW